MRTEAKKESRRTVFQPEEEGQFSSRLKFSVRREAEVRSMSHSRSSELESCDSSRFKSGILGVVASCRSETSEGAQSNAKFDPPPCLSRQVSGLSFEVPKLETRPSESGSTRIGAYAIRSCICILRPCNLPHWRLGPMIFGSLSQKALDSGLEGNHW
ncbi:hypothetical protein BJY04DRAFT_187689 [Aspergillus karnatakaensis]|uniref:uncharacterized protein n=1 Tax=Aspergillus karnatakaensis TaxID=1810916 RepID=UPI003CCE0625